MKDICILVNGMITGGVEKVLLEAIDAIKYHYNITLIILKPVTDESIKKQLENAENIQVIYRNFNSDIIRLLFYIPFVSGFVFDKLIGGKYDCLIVTKPHFLMAGYCHKASKKIYWNHGDTHLMYGDSKELNFFRKINKLRLRMAYNKFDKIWFVNDIINQKYTSIFKLKKTATLENSIDCKKIEELSNADNDMPDAKDTTTIVLLGRLSWEKGFIRVINALKSISCQSKYQVLIVGDGPEMDNLKAAADDHIIFMGQMKNPYPYLKKASLLVCPSYYESFGLVMLEAMALKTPIITTDTNGGRYVTAEGKYGKLIPNDDAELQESLCLFLQDPSSFSSYINPAYEWALKHDRSVFAKKMIALLDNE